MRFVSRTFLGAFFVQILLAVYLFINTFRVRFFGNKNGDFLIVKYFL